MEQPPSIELPAELIIDSLTKQIAQQAVRIAVLEATLEQERNFPPAAPVRLAAVDGG